MDVWWVDPLTKLLKTDGPEKTKIEGRIDAARGEVEAIQLAVRCPSDGVVKATAADFAPNMPVRVRAVGRVPIVRGTHRTPVEERIAPPPVDLPDPLFPKNEMNVKADTTESFWLDVAVPADARPGEYRSDVTITAGGETKTLPLVLHVYPVTIPFQGKFHLTNWFSIRPKYMGYGDAPAGSKAWWECADALFDSMWAHRQDYFWTPLRPPWIRPVVKDGKLAFDFSFFDKWVEEFSKPRGGQRKTYIEGQPIAWRRGYDGHVKARVWRVVKDNVQELVCEADDPDAREGYRVFLQALRDHLKSKGWLDRFRIHITDEPHGHQLKPYAVIAGYVREFAPEFKIMEALDVHDDFDFFDKYCDIWVPQLGRFNKTLPKMLQRLKEGKPVWIYTCLWPNGKYPNRFVDYPLIKTEVLQWINFKWGFPGYLHWGLNQWRGDPYRDLEPHHGGNTYLPPGDAWIIYPGRHAVVDSMRYEIMRDGVEDYELLTLLAERDNARAHAIADKIVQTFTEYERSPKRFREVRKELLSAFQ